MKKGCRVSSVILTRVRDEKKGGDPVTFGLINLDLK
jgi:hypothetical protein